MAMYVSTCFLESLHLPLRLANSFSTAQRKQQVHRPLHTLGVPSKPEHPGIFTNVGSLMMVFKFLLTCDRHQKKVTVSSDSTIRHLGPQYFGTHRQPYEATKLLVSGPEHELFRAFALLSNILRLFQLQHYVFFHKLSVPVQVSASQLHHVIQPRNHVPLRLEHRR